MLTMRPARAGEYERVVSFLEGHFGALPGTFIRMSHIYTRKPSVIGQTYLALRGEELVGAYGIFPRRLRVGAAELAAAGIGGVCTHRRHRGQGIMTFMIQTGDAIMQKTGTDVAALGGNRFRYGRFGWDGGGRRYQFRLTPRSLERNGVRPAPARACLPSKDLARLRRAHDALQYRLVRPKAYFQRIVGQPDHHVVVSDRTGCFAYAIYRQPDHLLEVAGHPDGLGAIAWRLLTRHGLDHVNVETGPEDSDLFRWLVRCGDYSRPHISASWQIRIIRLASTLHKLLPEIRRRAPRALPDGRITLVMRDSDQSATLRYGRRFAVEHRPCAARLVLSDMEMTRLILGPFPVGRAFGLTGRSTVLDHLLPVSWHWPILDHV